MCIKRNNYSSTWVQYSLGEMNELPNQERGVMIY